MQVIENLQITKSNFINSFKIGFEIQIKKIRSEKSNLSTLMNSPSNKIIK